MSGLNTSPIGRDDVVVAAVHAASRQLAAVGPVRMTVRTVAESAGVNHALIHRHLATKEHLISSALDLLANECLAEIDEIGSGGLTTLGLNEYPNIRRYVRALTRCLLEDDCQVAQTHFPVLDRVIEAGLASGLDDQTARARAVARQAAAFGLELFGEHLARAAGLPRADQGEPVSLLDQSFELLDVDLGVPDA